MKKIYVVYSHSEINNVNTFDDEMFGAFETFEKAKKNAKQIAFKKAEAYDRRYEDVDVFWDEENKLYVILSNHNLTVHFLESVRIKETSLN